MYYFSTLFWYTTQHVSDRHNCPSSGVMILYLQQLVFVILFVLTVC